jgi:deoxyribose-phosphate aldolase
MGTTFTRASLAKFVDHTQLKAGVTSGELEKACFEAREFGFFSVCVYWHQIPFVAEILRGSAVLPIAVVGFPSGEVDTKEKVSETQSALAAGAQEIDMVLNRIFMKRGEFAQAEEDIRQVVRTAEGKVVKVILEMSELTEAQKIEGCRIAARAGARFVKTSTGFSSGGATIEDVALMRREVGAEIGVKASGGIRSFEKAVTMLEAGANRLGTSASVEIVQGIPVSKGAY